MVIVTGTGAISGRKVSSTNDAPADAVAEGIGLELDALGVAPSSVDRAMHGTTVATNAILERKGARTGLLTTRGFRDVLQLGRLTLPRPYDVLYEKPAPLVPRRDRLEVVERVKSDGTVLVALDEEQAGRQIDALVEQRVDSVAICLLNSWANTAHEQRLAKLLAERAPDLFACVSSDLLNEVGEYERTSTTVVNAYVQPVVSGYLSSLERLLLELGLDAPLLVMQSSGGLVTGRVAAGSPAQIVESGPAAGVIAAREVAARAGVLDVISFDMGGTTAKASVIEGGEVRVIADYEVGGGLSSWNLATGHGFALKMPTLDIAEVGAGGGSIAGIDVAGGLRVGPASAGARPGPACYGRGGMAATVTDANVVLGYISPESIAGGSVRIDVERARAVIDEHVGVPLGLDTLRAAWAVHTIANTSMIGAIRAVTTKRGRDPRRFTLMAFGGSGPVHASGIASQLDVPRVIVPALPGLFSALGLLLAEPEARAATPFYRRLLDAAPAELTERYAAVERELAASLPAIEGARTRARRLADLRYVGQGNELTVALPDGDLTTGSLEALRAAFDDEHRRTYGHAFTDAELEFVSLRATAVLEDGSAHSLSRLGPPDGECKLCGRQETRPAYFPDAGPVDAAVVCRHALRAQPLSGPAIVEEPDATTVVPPGTAARLLDGDSILLERPS